MKTRVTLLALSAMLLPQLTSAALPWASRSYERTTVPDAYSHSKAQPMRLSSEYPREGMPYSVQVADFVGVYGTPSAAYVPKRQAPNYRSYLVYELQDGYSLAVQLPSLQDGSFYAAMLFDPTGKRVGAVIK